MDDPRVAAAWFLGDDIAGDDPLREVKLRALAHDAAAEVTGQAERRAGAGVRAERLEEAAGMFADHAFDPMETWDAGLAAGLGDADLDAAAHVALVLEQVERGL